MALVQREVLVIVFAYLLAGIPIGGVALAGRMSPLYRMQPVHLRRWWSRFALVIVLLALTLAAAG